MTSRKLFFLFLIFFVNFSQAQRRKKVDTIYVYEKVVVYDTVYLIKPLHFKSNDLIFGSPKVQEKSFVRNIYQEELEKQRAKRRISGTKNNSFEYGIEAGIGFKKSEWSKVFSADKEQFGENIGIWFSKNLFDNLNMMLSANIYHWNSTFDIDASKDESSLNGFYFTEDHQPLLFQRFNNKHFDYTLQLKALYEWKGWRPFAGILVNQNTYKMQFLIPENNVLSKMDDFKSRQTSVGFSFGLQYRFFRKFLLSLEYQQYKMKNISLKNSSFDFEIFQTNDTFAERKINFGISYCISRN